MTSRTRYQQKQELAAISPADIALTRTAACYGQARWLRIREGVKLLRMKAKQ